jgi:cell wall-associated NlpC family hydrolase
VSALGNQIRDYVLGRTGQQVGRGECTDLVTFALREVGVQSTYPHHGDHYVWGTPIALADAEPGDLLQFRSHHMVVRNAGGEEVTENRGHPSHTAVVIENLGNGRLRVAEQNMINPGGQRVRNVVTNTIYVRSQMTADNRSVIVSGEVWAFRAQAGAPVLAVAGRR